VQPDALSLRAEGTDRIIRWCAEDDLVHAIGRIFALEDVCRGHEIVE